MARSLQLHIRAMAFPTASPGRCYIFPATPRTAAGGLRFVFERISTVSTTRDASVRDFYDQLTR